MEALKNKRGCIRVDQDNLREMDIENLKLFFSNFYPISINSNHLFMDESLKYFGYSEHFEEVGEGEPAIEYEVEITRIENGNNTIKFIKV